MAKNETSSSISSSLSHSSPFLTSSSSILGAFVPCAACKILRRKCTETCLLAPHFPPDDPLNFAAVHRLFGASSVVKLLQVQGELMLERESVRHSISELNAVVSQDVPERQRDDAAKSLVYEAKARLRDPVYGSAGVVFQLQRRVVELQAQVAMAEAELFAVRAQHADLLALVCMKTAAPVAPPPDEPCLNDDGELGPSWEHLLWA